MSVVMAILAVGMAMWLLECDGCGEDDMTMVTEIWFWY
jgi:hypothetical protein